MAAIRPDPRSRLQDPAGRLGVAVLPIETIAAQQVAASAPGRLPANVGDRYSRPASRSPCSTGTGAAPCPGTARRRALGRVTVLVCVGRHRGHAGQAEVEGGTGVAEPLRHGRMNPPRQASTWQPTPRSAATPRSRGSGRSPRAGSPAPTRPRRRSVPSRRRRAHRCRPGTRRRPGPAPAACRRTGRPCRTPRGR